MLAALNNENHDVYRKQEEMVSNEPSREMVDKQAFSIVNKAIHFGLNSGISIAFSFLYLDFISLQLTKISWTFCVIAVDVESTPLFASCKVSASMRNARSLEPMVGTLLLVEWEMSGFNNLIRKRMQLGESKRWSSWPWNVEIWKVKV